MTTISPLSATERDILIQEAVDMLFGDPWSGSRFVQEATRGFGLMTDSALKTCISRMSEYEAESLEFNDETRLIRHCMEHIDWEDNRDYLNSRALFVLVEAAPVAHAFSDYIDSMHDSASYRFARVAINLAFRVKEYDDIASCARGFALEQFCVGPSDFNTPLQRWLTEHALELSAHAEVLTDRHTVDPEFCESLLNTAPALADGTL